MTTLRMFFLAATTLFPLYGFALTAVPMDVSVQTGDTLSTPYFMRGWDSLATGVTVSTSNPLHGNIRTVVSWYDSNAWYIPMDTSLRNKVVPRRKTPRGYPGFVYVPAAGFTGLDSFTFRVRTSLDSTVNATVRVRVTPPEPGNMTVLLVVHAGIYPSIQAEVERLRADLVNEGYQSRILPWTVPASWTLAHAKQIWDTLVAEYRRPDRMLAGAIMIGKVPYCNFGLIRESAFWSMSLWEPDNPDTVLLGYKVGVPGYNGTQYTPGFTNIWVSRMHGANSVGPSLGTEAVLLKRILDNNHDYRTNASRLPHTAMYNSMFTPNAEKNRNPSKYRDIWPSLFMKVTADTTSPLALEFRRGGQIWDITTHGNNDYYQASLNSSNGYLWRYETARLSNAIFPIRFLLATNCHAGGVGWLTNNHLLVRGSGCVLSMSPSDYVSHGFSMADTASRYPPHSWTRSRLAQGDRWGRAWLRGNGWIWSVIFHGDLSLKPKMDTPNQLPRISTLTAVKTGALSWSFTVAASDSDDGITGYDWWGTSYRNGNAAPDSSGIRTAFSMTYPSAGICTVRVEAVDHYKARAWATVILKTDSGVIGTTERETALFSPIFMQQASVFPNPMTREAALSFNMYRQGHAKIFLLDPAGRTVSMLHSGSLTAGRHRMAINAVLAGKQLPSGVYMVQIDLAGEKINRKILILQ